ncbi:proton-conducting transporter membrane subunit [Geobacter grbiciae]|uniref:proton-conducting transporter transmembrane domain-containing protein n=1 Tax=Geobacter grbiciae TaxID=155042 RepID=UPI001C01A7D2|nr:proton-conducting transporter membrane subunit [Geobacter grbiciae]MBT1076403.1 hydrogenase [Geobacter grbiciae]
MITGLLLIPLLGALTAWFIPSDRGRPWALPVTGAIHLALTVEATLSPTAAPAGMWLHLDAIGKLVLLSVSLLFFASGLYAVGYLAYRRERPNRILCAMLLVCLSAMTLVAFAHHLGLLWVAIETTTLTMTPLLYFNRNARSIEATWKYMLICSVGIALALLGLLFLAYSTVVARIEPTLLLEPLVANARLLSPAWLKAAFVFLLVGYGTKMGLTPLHTWKPDAYGEAPGLVGGLLAGGLVTCSFVGLLRVYQVCVAASGTTFHRDALVLMGLLSMATAAIFMARQADFKRMLAYSSVEHVGILAVALGLGKGALAGALLHLVNNSLTKGVLFLAAANIHRSYNSKRCEQVRGALRRLPWSGGLFLAGFFAVTGSPPFGLFVSEFSIISSAMTQGGEWIGGLILFFLAAIFLGMARTVLPVVMGESSRIEHTGYRDRFLTVVPPLILMGVVLMLGLWIPAPLSRLITEGAALLGGNVP